MFPEDSSIMATFLIYLLLGLTSLIHGSAYTFPYGKCYDKKCDSSPYRLTWLPLDPSLDTSDEARYCMRFQTKPCNDTDYKCCSTLQKALVKFELHVRTECKDAVKRVTVDGIPKGGGVFFDVYTDTDSELRITSLVGLNSGNIENKTFCVHVTKPCIPLANFLKTNNTAIWEVTKHECCPRCMAAYGELPGPPNPPPGPPPPGLPPPKPATQCGNGVCEPDLGEHCGTCKKDCRGGMKFCCGLDRPLCKQFQCFRKGYMCGRTNLTVPRT